ncbi:DUF441 domain-containing protein [Halonatronum saccharophilum]|uniref:DUF441 domain-containing protein n=1 Tax=Halonatronum saccharophilum TaxID=150060 RepID=UPI000481F31E|nr:DUF441 domain-containing protein [Halonatronum saccharophilum]
MEINLTLLIIGILGLIVKNDSLIIAGFFLLILRLFRLDGVLNIVDNYTVRAGIILIMVGVLAPLATGKLELTGLRTALVNPLAIVALVMGIAVTQFTREGLNLMEVNPQVTINLVLGVVLGVAFFKGVPSGPLIASGITAVIYKLLSLFF